MIDRQWSIIDDRTQTVAGLTTLPVNPATLRAIETPDVAGCDREPEPSR